MKREAAARRKAEKRARDREERRNKQMELGWAGRSGGFDARPTSKGSVHSSNGRGGSLPRVSGADKNQTRPG
ncbi:unnamed protein product [Ectocarpus fasciculatus]